MGAIAIIQGVLSVVEGARACQHIRTYRPKAHRNDSVLVFCPCKGVDHDFEKNIRSLLEQDYPRYAVRFVVESQEDDAFGALSRMGIRDILVSGRASHCGQKVR